MSFNPETTALVRRLGEQARATIAARAHETPTENMAASVAAETMGAAFACGVANGRHGGEREVTVGAALPADLVVGVALHGIALLLRSGSDPEPHAAALGTGALAACAYRTGERLGASMRRAAVQPQVAPPAPALAPASPVGETFTVIAIPPSNGGTKR